MSIENEGLTPEELAAMQEDDTIETDDVPEDEPEKAPAEPDDAASAAASAAEETDGLTEEERAAAAEQQQAEQQAADDANKPPAQEEEQPGRDDGAPVDEPEAKQAPAVPLIRGEKPADYDQQMAALDAREDALVEKFEDGDITTREYNAEIRKINDERGDLKWQSQKAELAAETSQAQAEAQWYGAVDVFFQAHPEIQANQTRLDAFDSIVRKVTAETMAAGKVPGAADLAKAYKQWAEDLGIQPAAKEDKPENKGQQQQQQAKPRNVPPTLAKVPAADATDVENSKFASLDRLADSDPLKYQEAIDRMSPAERDAYNQYAG
ncbi:TPA: hypothetical protein SMF87_004576 [Serratia marcescens]|nr:hypothetical protein [Serratia marcescens]